MGTLRVVQFSPHFPPYPGGVETVAYEFAQTYTQQWYGEIITVTADIKQPVSAADGILRKWRYIGYKSEAWTVLLVPSFHIVYNFPFPKFRTRQFRAVLAYVRNRHADIIQTHTRFFLITLLWGVCAHLRQIPRVHVEHGSGFVKGLVRWKKLCADIYDHTIWRIVLRNADSIIAISQANTAFIKKFTDKEVHVIYRGLSVKPLNSALRDEETALQLADTQIVKIGYVWRLVTLKWVDLLIDALHYITDTFGRTDRKLYIVWEGDAHEYLIQLVKKYWLSEHIVFLWFKKNDRVQAVLLKHLDILVNPSYQEGLPTTVIEWLLAECLVVATDVGGTAEITSLDDMRLCEAWNAKDLAEKIADAMQHLERKWISHTAVIQRFSREKSAELYFTLYKTLVWKNR